MKRTNRVSAVLLLNRRVNWSKFLTAGLCNVFLGCGVSQGAVSPAACPTIGWSVLETTSTPALVRLRYGIVDSIRLVFAQAANETPKQVWTYFSGAEPVPMPEPGLLNAQVRGAADGPLHLVWGSDSPPGFEDFYSTRLWHSSFAEGRWSEPEMIAHARKLFWGGSRQLAIDAAGRVHVAMEATDSVFSKIIHIVRSDSSVFQHQVASSGVAAEVAIAVSGSDTIVIAYLAPVQHGDKNSVFFVRSLNAGTLWSKESLLQFSNSLAANNLQAHLAGSTIHLLWLQSRSGSNHDILRYLRSDDLGGTWLAPADFDLMDPISAYRSMVDKEGNLHVLYNVVDGDMPFNLRYVIWSRGWRAQAEPLPNSAVISFDVHPNSAGLPEVAAATLRYGDDAFGGPRLVLASATCEDR